VRQDGHLIDLAGMCRRANRHLQELTHPSNSLRKASGGVSDTEKTPQTSQARRR
jgi:hypothetical protein